MDGFTFLICLQILSLHTWLHPFHTVSTVSASQTHDQDRDRGKYGLNRRNGNDNNNINNKANRDARLQKDEFGIDDFLGTDDNFEEFDDTGQFEEAAVEGLETYDPISDTFRSKSRNGNRQKTIRPDVDNFNSDLPGDVRRAGKKAKTDRGANDISRNSLNGSVVSTNTRKDRHHYDVHTVHCPEKCACDGTKVDCVGKNLTSVPKGISSFTTWLDISMNSLQKLPEDTFAHMTSLKELRCVGNNLTQLPNRLFRHNTYLQLLNFQGNLFSRVPPRAFQNLHFLQELHLDANVITNISRNAFVGLTSLKQLWLDDNKLSHVPSSALQELTGIQALTLIKNEITHLPAYVFQNNTRLIQLRLANNAIRDIDDQAFYGLTRLKYLQLQHNEIRNIPSAFSYLVSLVEINLKYNQVTAIPDKSFQMKDKLTTLNLEHNPIAFVAESAFANLPSLQEIKLSDVHDMTRFPDLTDTSELTVLHIDRANIRSIPEDLCTNLKKLKSFDMHSNKIVTIQSMSQCRHLTILNMGNNELASIDGQLFVAMSHLKDITLNVNLIHTISEDTFVGLVALEYLNLAKNQIGTIHPNAFLPLKSLRDLNLGNNKIHQLPTAGLVSLQKLKIHDNPDLREFPPKEQFPNVDHFVLSYAYHCCDFILSRPEPPQSVDVLEDLVFLDTANGLSATLQERHENFSDEVFNILKPLGDNASEHLEMYFDNFTTDTDLWDHMGNSAFELDRYQDQPASTYLEDYLNHGHDNNYLIAKAAISCKPSPGPFMPCDDLFGWWSLRCGVWFVFMLALLGNGVVFFVSVTSKSKMDVPRFLICNLALADFFMGIYLGILAIMDASTLGHFKKYAIQWQMSAGCLVAGTLGVLSSELSVFTLTVITLERFYAITHAMQLNKRLSLKHAGVIMMCGWIWSFGLAILPLFGVSDYRKFAVCLPFEIDDVISKSYVCFIMVFNGISFFTIMGCYLIMYISIRDSQAWNSNDTRVAKRMALLVFTDFLCWAPIAFLSLAAAFGKNLIELNEAKVLTIFILPLNSCANPFLYAFFTKQFKKDCVLLCRRLEDSFVARHFSQVTQRHASMSWKYQRRPSALHSLMGESKSHNSQNNSNGSNSYGLLNYNSEISSGTNKTAGNEVAKPDMYVTQATIYSVSNSGAVDNGTTYYKHAHKYKPCPSSENDNDNKIVKESYADISDDDDDDIQVILHQDFYSQRETAIQGCTVESCMDDDCEHLILSSQRSCDDSLEDGLNIKPNGSLPFQNTVISEEEHMRRDEAYLWRKRSLQNPHLELPDIPQQRQNETSADTDHTGHKLDCEKSKIGKTNKNEKQINGRRQINLTILGDNSSEFKCMGTSKFNEDGGSHLLAKLSLTRTNIDFNDVHGKEQLVALRDKQKTSECKNTHVPLTNICEGHCIKSNAGKSRENMHCKTTTFTPVESNNHTSPYMAETHLLESELCKKCQPVSDLEYILLMPQEIRSDKTKIINQETILDSKGVPTIADGQLDNSDNAAVVILLKRDHGEITNSPINQNKLISLPSSLSIGCYTNQCIALASPTNFCSKTKSVLQESKRLNLYQQQLYTELPGCCDKNISTNDSAHNLTNARSSHVSASIDNAHTEGLLSHQKTEDRNGRLQSVNGCETLSKSSSLVELSQVNVDEVTTPLLTSVKRRSLPLNRECYVLP